MLERIMWATFGVVVFLLAQRTIGLFEPDRDYADMALFLIATIFGAVRQQSWVINVSGRWKKKESKED